jgi:hypothetical protein
MQVLAIVIPGKGLLVHISIEYGKGGWGLVDNNILPDDTLVARWDLHCLEIVVVLLEGTAGEVNCW